MAFRASFLRLFKSADARALAQVGTLLYDAALECGREWHLEPEVEIEGALRGAAADLRFLEGLLAATGREYLEASLDARETILSQLAASLAPEVAGLADRIEQALEG